RHARLQEQTLAGDLVPPVLGDGPLRPVLVHQHRRWDLRPVGAHRRAKLQLRAPPTERPDAALGVRRRKTDHVDDHVEATPREGRLEPRPVSPVARHLLDPRRHGPPPAVVHRHRVPTRQQVLDDPGADEPAAADDQDLHRTGTVASLGRVQRRTPGGAFVVNNELRPPRRRSAMTLRGMVLVTFVSARALAAETPPGAGEVATAAGDYAREPAGDYLARQKAFLEHAARANPAGLYSQVARLALDRQIDEDAIRSALVTVNTRRDGADFVANGLARIYSSKSLLISPSLRGELKSALIGMKYWVDEPGGKDLLSMWSENHQINYHSAEYL